MIADQIHGRSNPWANLYSPARPSPKNFNKGGESPSGIASIADLAPGEGGIIKDGKQKLAVCKDDNGQPHALSASCTHKGCTVTWNNAERTWDCLCHGSMFNADHPYSQPGGQATVDQENACETTEPPRATIGLAIGLATARRRAKSRR
jgi:nitrite reductase/ring-hydroxylating ferredoxin subunit